MQLFGITHLSNLAMVSKGIAERVPSGLGLLEILPVIKKKKQGKCGISPARCYPRNINTKLTHAILCYLSSSLAECQAVLTRQRVGDDPTTPATPWEHNRLILRASVPQKNWSKSQSSVYKSLLVQAVGMIAGSKRLHSNAIYVASLARIT